MTSGKKLLISGLKRPLCPWDNPICLPILSLAMAFSRRWPPMCSQTFRSKFSKFHASSGNLFIHALCQLCFCRVLCGISSDLCWPIYMMDESWIITGMMVLPVSNWQFVRAETKIHTIFYVVFILLGHKWENSELILFIILNLLLSCYGKNLLRHFRRLHYLT